MSEQKLLISVCDLCVNVGETTVLSDITFDIKSGELVGILGGNGAVKSTLAKALLKLIPSTGSILYQGSQLTGKQIAADFSYVPQSSSFDRSFPITVEEVLLLECNCAEHTPEVILQKSSLFGVTSLLDKKVSQLSGGQLQKVLITRALISDPKVVIMDEPTNNLDAAAIKKFDQLLHDLKKHEVTVVVVTHNHDLLHTLSDNGRLLEVVDGKVKPHVHH